MAVTLRLDVENHISIEGDVLLSRKQCGNGEAPWLFSRSPCSSTCCDLAQSSTDEQGSVFRLRERPVGRGRCEYSLLSSVLLVHGLIIAQKLNAELESERLKWQEAVKHCGKPLRGLQISWRSV